MTIDARPVGSYIDAAGSHPAEVVNELTRADGTKAVDALVSFTSKQTGDDTTPEFIQNIPLVGQAIESSVWFELSKPEAKPKA